MLSLKFLFKNLNFLFNEKFDVVFYSEGIHYQKFFINLAESLSKLNYKILYMSSEKNDKINNPSVKNLYANKGIFLSILFNFIKSKILITTTSDIGNNILKKNKKIFYLYFFHSPMSTHKSYTPNAFNNYDAILCNGEYQYNEILELENLNLVKNKILLKTGYLYFDELKKYENYKCDDQILVAPGWSKSNDDKSLKNYENVIDYLLKNTEYKIVFRPHIEQIKRNKEIIDRIHKNFINYNKFIFDQSKDNLDILKKSKFLITNKSGISIEFTLIFKRPVFYIHQSEKIHNLNFKKINQIPLEDQIEDNFGIKLTKYNYSDILQDLNVIYEKFSFHSKNIDLFKEKNFYNFGKATQFSLEEIKKILINLS